MIAGVRSASEGERDAATEALVNAVIKEVEPLLVENDKGQGPFFGGSDRLTFAEVSFFDFLEWPVLRSQGYLTETRMSKVNEIFYSAQ